MGGITSSLEAIATRLEAVVTLEAIAIGLETITSRLKATAAGLEAIATRLETIATFQAIAIWLDAVATRLEAIATGFEATATRLEAIATKGEKEVREKLKKQSVSTSCCMPGTAHTAPQVTTSEPAHFAPSSFLFLVVGPASLLLVAVPFAPSSFLLLVRV